MTDEQEKPQEPTNCLKLVKLCVSIVLHVAFLILINAVLFTPSTAAELQKRSCDLAGTSTVGDQLSRFQGKPKLGLAIVDKRLYALKNGSAETDSGDWKTDFTDYSAIFAPVSRKSLTRLEYCRLYNYRGVINTKADQLQQGEADFRKSISYMNRYSNTWSNLAVIMHKLGKSREASEYCKTALSINPRCPAALKAKHDLEEAAGQNKKAKQSEIEYQRVLLQNKKDGLDPELMDLATNVQAELEKMPPSAIVCNALGLLHWNHLRFEQAEAYYRKGMSCKPSNFLPFYNFGRLESWRGKNREALKLFEAAIAVDPSSPLPYMQLANSQKKLNDLKSAVANYSKFLKLYPYSDNLRAMGFILRSECNSDRKQYERALQDLSLVDPVNCSTDLKANALLKSANLLKKLGRKRDALKAYDRAIAIAPNAPVLLKERGELTASLGEFEEGMMDLSKSAHQVESSKRTEIAVPTKKQLLDMIAEQSKLILLAPKSESLYYDRGILQLMGGNFDAAVSDLKMVLSLNKESSQTTDAAICFSVVALNLSSKKEAAEALLKNYAAKSRGPHSTAFGVLSGRMQLQAAVDKTKTVDEKTRGFTILGMYLYSINHTVDARKLLDWVCTNGNVSADEYPLAIAYLEKCKDRLVKLQSAKNASSKNASTKKAKDVNQ
jgi:tetratricopeptide (TPR) repeat protein